MFNSYKYWLNKESNNSLYQLDDDVYEELDEDIKDKYSHGDTNKNIFTIECLFNDLSNNIEDSALILPNMMQSFKKLAYSTSRIDDMC